MDLETFITAVFCLADDFVADFTRTQPQKLRQRGPAPTLADSEVLTVEVVGEFLGIATDQGLYRHFRRHHAALFPALARVHRTTFARQAANLWGVKRALWEALAARLAPAPRLHVVDSAPVPVCRFVRAPWCRRLRGVATYGYDPIAKQTFYGLRAHLRVAWPGIITRLDLAPAHVADVAMAPELLAAADGWALGDRAYWSPALREALGRHALALLAPFRTRAGERRPWPRWLVQTRRRIETVLAQLVERFHLTRVWARDRWHLSARVLRKVLSHTTAVLLCLTHGLEPLHFDKLLAD
jgi:hypothetical protein